MIPAGLPVPLPRASDLESQTRVVKELKGTTARTSSVWKSGPVRSFALKGLRPGLPNLEIREKPD